MRIRYTRGARRAAALRGGDGGRASRAREEPARQAVERFEMPQPIPPYLFAFAVGDLASQGAGAALARVGRADGAGAPPRDEFADVDDMLRAAEALFGPVRLGALRHARHAAVVPVRRHGEPAADVPHADADRRRSSLVNVVAHELAHSWTGNLVTNANAEHFWLNEGFTVFAERRILEALEGAEVAALHAALGRRALDDGRRSGSRAHPELTRLRTHLTGVDPDEAFSQVPYEKGYLFLRALEDGGGPRGLRRVAARVHRHVPLPALTTEDFWPSRSASCPACWPR